MFRSHNADSKYVWRVARQRDWEMKFSTGSLPFFVQMSEKNVLSAYIDWRVASDVLAKNFVHFEHVYFVCVKDSPHGFITDNFAFVIRLLKLVLFDMDPDLFHDLRS